MKYNKFIILILCLLNLILIPNLKCQGSLFQQMTDTPLNDNNPISISNVKTKILINNNIL